MIAALSALVSGALTASVVGQTTLPTATQDTGWELPEDVRAALSRTQDFAFNFDQPGFYAVVEFVKHSTHSPGYAQAPIEIQDWRDLLERPADFRGRPVTIEGSVGHNKDPYILESHRELGFLQQLELQRPDQPLTCTVILTGSAAGIPRNATLTVTGYFVMIRSYYGPSNRVQHAALLVAPGPTTIGQAVPRASPRGILDWRWGLVAVVTVLLIVVIVLRRSVAARRRESPALHARHEAPLSLADDLAAWARDPRQTTDADSPQRRGQEDDDR